MSHYVPQTILTTLFVLAVIRGAKRHGKPLEGKTNAVGLFLTTAFVLACLFWGGFYG